jgi:Peptidase family S41
MKKLLFLASLTFFAATAAYNQSPKIAAQPWASDLKTLSEKINKSFAGFTPEMKTQFDRDVETLARKLPSLTEPQVLVEMGKVLARLQDGHTELNLLQRTAKLRRLPLGFYKFKEGIYLTGASEQYRDHLGSKLIQIGGFPADTVFERIKPLLARDNAFEFDLEAPNYMIVPEILFVLGVIPDANVVSVVLQGKDGMQSTLNVAALAADQYLKARWVRMWEADGGTAPVYLQNQAEVNWFRYFEREKTMYIHIGRFENRKGEKFKTFVKETFAQIDALRPEKLAFDLRLNRGGNYKLGKPLLRAVLDRPDLNRAGKLFVVTGRQTFSAATVMAVFFKQQTRASIVGEISRGNPNGCDNYETFKLPHSGLMVGYATRFKNHAPELLGQPYVPVNVELLNGIRELSLGQDRVLEYIFKQ